MSEYCLLLLANNHESNTRLTNKWNTLQWKYIQHINCKNPKESVACSKHVDIQLVFLVKARSPEKLLMCN